MEDQTALFNQYENEYCNKSTDISRKINAIANLSGELRRKKILEVEADIKEADSVIRRMDMEARSLAPDKSKQLQLKVREYKADYSNLKEQMKKAQATASTADAARAELGLGDNYYSSSAGQRERMLAANEKLQKTSEKLTLGRQQLAETEELGAQALAELRRQREVIQNAKQTIAQASEDAKQGNKTATTMYNRTKWWSLG